MSEIIYNPQACAVGVENIGQNTCVATKMLPLSGYFSRTEGAKYKIADLQDEEFIQNELAAQRLFKLPQFSVAVSLEQTEIETNTNNYGNINVISTKAAMNASFGLNAGTCTFRKLKQWQGRKVTMFFVDNNRFAGQIDTIGGDLALRGIDAQLAVRQGIKFKTEENDALIEAVELNVQSPNANIDEFVTVGYNPAQKTGITDSVITVVSAALNSIVVSVKTACDATEVSGLVGADFYVNDINGDRVTVTATEGDTGTYTLAGTLPLGVYGVSLDGTVDVGGFLYATFGVPVTADSTGS